MKKILILLSLIVFMASCASNSGTRNKLANADVSHQSKVVLADKNSKEKVICKQIRKTGTHRVTTVCRTQSEIEKTRQATQNELIGTSNQSGTCAAYGTCGQ